MSTHPGFDGWTPTRRALLKALAAGGALGAGALGGCTRDRSTALPSSKGAPTAQLGSPADPRNRRLVVLELTGGNDGWSTLVPHGHGAYHDLRPTLAVGSGDVIDWSDGYGLHRRLESFDRHGVAAVTGVGVTRPDLSHFEMLDRWWGGAEDGRPPEAAAGYPSGFLGRLCDAVRGHEDLTGVSLRFGSSLALRTTAAGTAGLGDLVTAAEALADDGDDAGRLFRAYGSVRTSDARSDAATGLAQVVWILDLLGRLAAPTGSYPDGAFGHQLALTSRLLRSADGPRVIHVPMAGANFDTHAKHEETQTLLFDELNAGVDALMVDLAANGLSDHVLVATTSEFGRRPEEHGGGLDHGTASTMLMLGPVKPGLHGEPSPLDRFDDRDNLISTMGFGRYYATLASWLGADPAVAGSPFGGPAPEPLAGVLTV